MDLHKILSELKSELEQIDAAILAVEKLVQLKGSRRGRPPKWLAEVQAAKPAKRRGRPPGSGKRKKTARVPGGGDGDGSGT